MTDRRRESWMSYLLAGIVLAGIFLLIALPGPATAQGDPTPTPFYETNDDPEFNAQMDYVEEAVSILRDLEEDEQVTRAFISREQLLVYLTDMLDRDYPPERARDDAIFYHALGLMDLDVDLRAVQLDVLAEQIGGFYDPEIEVMFVIGDVENLSALNQLLYAHEFTHALQDQVFDLEALGLGETDNDLEPDTLLALQGLVEGDAMLLTIGYQNWLMESDPAGYSLGMLAEALNVQTEALFAAPQILQDELMFPYTDGQSFVYGMFSVGNGWGYVNSIYDDPPVSTEQILHPERYLADHEPLPVTVAPLDEALGDGWRLVYERTLGEFYLRQHLRALIDEEVADEAAEGWGGDRYRLYFNDDTEETVFVLRLIWDRPEDAAEFAATYRGYGAIRFDDPGVPTDTTTCWYGEIETLCLFVGENETLIATVPDRAMIADVIATQPEVR